MRARITLNQTSGEVTLAYDGTNQDVSSADFGEPCRIERQFMVPAHGGYIREWDTDSKEWRQVCDRLYRHGNCLHARDDDDLLRIIRREYHAMRRAEQRAAE